MPTSLTAKSPGAPEFCGADQVRSAGATALATLGQGTVTSIDLERSGTVWEVEITTRAGGEHEMRVSRDGTTVVSGPAQNRGAGAPGHIRHHRRRECQS
jgi:hypothetical protein